MRRVIIVILSILLILLIAWKFTNKPTALEPVEELVLLNPAGPTVIPIAGLDNPELDSDLEVRVKYWNNVDEVLAALAKDEAQFIVMPITAGVNMYNQGLDISLLGVHEWKVFYLVAKQDMEFEDWSSMQDKQVYTPVGKGQTADVLMRSAFKAANLEAGVDVNINYAPPQEIVALFKEGKIDYAAIPEPFVSMLTQGGNGKIVLDFQEYWADISGFEPRIPIAGLFVANKFLETYPHETGEFIKVFNQSIAWANTNPDLAIERTSELLPVPAPIIKSALERIDFYFLSSQECQPEIEAFLTKVKELDDESISKLPDAKFYGQK